GGSPAADTIKASQTQFQSHNLRLTWGLGTGVWAVESHGVACRQNYRVIFPNKPKKMPQTLTKP
ncbi:MAG: hypothetical protein KAH56_05000, partial [Candidatus Krumholzibacteria bacterium]|nr:hypothetical protein [Candidatus Krumholzibacteria bacterium]